MTGRGPRVAIAVVGVLAVVTVSIALNRGGGGGDDSAAPASPGSIADLDAICEAWDSLAGTARAVRTPDLAPLPADPELRLGDFDSGLRYYVRENGRPGANVVLALAVGAGAAFEDGDQHGAAHYLEHMLFNGTERFPGNQLSDVLRELGVEPGADLNAFTSEDGTVYHLELANDQQSIELGLDVLLEWATQATLAAKDVDDERGVILEELRAGLGPDERFFDRLRDLTLHGTPYEGHEVVGTTESIAAMDQGALRRFYDDWYRPDMMSVIAVGDFDAATVEAEIHERFGPIEARTDARQTPTLESGRAPGPRFDSYQDDELAATSAEVVFTRPSEALTTHEDLRRHMLRDVAVTALGRRLNDDAARGLVPFYEVDAETFNQVREFDSLLLSVDAEPEQLDGALTSMIHELARVRRDGLTEAEIARAVAVRRTHSLATGAGAASIQDRDLMFRFVESALAQAPTTTSEELSRIELSILDRITPAEVDDELRRITTCADMAVQAGAPGEHQNRVPDRSRIADMLASATSDELRSRAPENEVPASIMAAPEPVAPVHRTEAMLFGPAIFLEYPNGAQVVINPSDIATGKVTIAGDSPGGLAEVEAPDLSNARAASRLVSDSGVGELDSVALARVLATSDAFAHTNIGTDVESIHAGGSATDLETILQLVNQRMTNPRIDDGAVATYQGESRLAAENPSRRADWARARAIDQLVWHDDARLRHLTTAEDLNALSPSRALALHRDRFGDVGDFVFVIVGDLDPAATEDLVHRYLGSLPSVGRIEDGTYSAAGPPTSVVSQTVEAGTAPQASIELVFDVRIGVDPVVRDRADALEAVLDNQLRGRLREELGAAYSLTTSIDADERTGRVRTFIDVRSDPARIDEVARELQAIITDLRESGPADADVQRALEPLVRNLQFIDHEVIVATWIYALRHPDRPIQDAPAAAEVRLRDLDAVVVRQLARLLLPAGAHIEVVQVPAKR